MDHILVSNSHLNKFKTQNNGIRTGLGVKLIQATLAIRGYRCYLSSSYAKMCSVETEEQAIGSNFKGLISSKKYLLLCFLIYSVFQ